MYLGKSIATPEKEKPDPLASVTCVCVCVPGLLSCIVLVNWPTWMRDDGDGYSVGLED